MDARVRIKWTRACAGVRDHANEMEEMFGQSVGFKWESQIKTKERARHIDRTRRDCMMPTIMIILILGSGPIGDNGLENRHIREFSPFQFSRPS